MEKLIGKVLKKSINLKIEIIDIQKELPENEKTNFLLWLESVAVSSGLGKHFDHYGYTEDYKDDIPVLFNVTIDY